MVILSDQMDSYRSGAWKGGLSWKHGFGFIIKLIVEASGVYEVI